MTTVALVADLSSALVPRHCDADRRAYLAEYFLTRLPVPIRLVLVVLVRALWLLSAVARRGQPTRMAAMAAWVSSLVHSQVPLLHSVGLWLKATACMIVLGDGAARRALYEARGIAYPADVRVTEENKLVGMAPRLAGAYADEADFIVVGTGPAGATVARTLAQEGHEVVMVEEGPATPDRWAAQSTLEVLGERFRGAGAFTTRGPERIPLLQGIGVGGSSVINSAIVWRAPEDVFAAWHQDPALAEHFSLARIEAAYVAVERAAGVERTAVSVYGGGTALMAKAADAMGLSSAPTLRYTKGCEGLGRCLEGCPKGRKLAMNLTFIPAAIEAGARLYTDCRVQAVCISHGRATGVRAALAGKTVKLWARRGVVVAASCIQTPLVLRASGLRHPALGRRFQAHPGCSVAGIFDVPVRYDPRGATQGYDSIHFRLTDRFKPESIVLPDELLATRFPGVGFHLAQALAELPHTAVWAAPVRARAMGSVSGSLGMPSVSYHFLEEDRIALGKAIRTLGEMLFAAGARTVMPAVLGWKTRMTDPSELRGLERGVSPRQVAMIISHMFGTAVMGGDPQRSVCDPYGRVHAVAGLYVADSSLFPTNMGVNPQHTIMALAQHLAWGIVEQRGEAAKAA